MFCTTGILLRRLAGDAQLQSVSHVIVDEVGVLLPGLLLADQCRCTWEKQSGNASLCMPHWEAQRAALVEGLPQPARTLKGWEVGLCAVRAHVGRHMGRAGWLCMRQPGVTGVSRCYPEQLNVQQSLQSA